MLTINDKWAHHVDDVLVRAGLDEDAVQLVEAVGGALQCGRVVQRSTTFLLWLNGSDCVNTQSDTY
jgi:hypothetical protein